jgi:hypothetical protein
MKRDAVTQPQAAKKNKPAGNNKSRAGDRFSRLALALDKRPSSSAVLLFDLDLHLFSWFTDTEAVGQELSTVPARHWCEWIDWSQPCNLVLELDHVVLAELVRPEAPLWTETELVQMKAQFKGLPASAVNGQLDEHYRMLEYRQRACSEATRILLEALGTDGYAVEPADLLCAEACGWDFEKQEPRLSLHIRSGKLRFRDGNQLRRFLQRAVRYRGLQYDESLHNCKHHNLRLINQSKNARSRRPLRACDYQGKPVDDQHWMPEDRYLVGVPWPDHMPAKEETTGEEPPSTVQKTSQRRAAKASLLPENDEPSNREEAEAAELTEAEEDADPPLGGRIYVPMSEMTNELFDKLKPKLAKILPGYQEPVSFRQCDGNSVLIVYRVDDDNEQGNICWHSGEAHRNSAWSISLNPSSGDLRLTRLCFKTRCGTEQATKPPLWIKYKAKPALFHLLFGLETRLLRYSLPASPAVEQFPPDVTVYDEPPAADRNFKRLYGLCFDPSPKFNVLALVGGPGCGKTTAVVEALHWTDMLVVTPRVCVAEEWLSRVPVNKRASVVINYRKWSGQPSELYCMSLVIQYDSLPRAHAQCPLRLVLDEFPDLLEHALLSQTVTQPGYALGVLFQRIRDAYQVILLSADLRPEHMELIRLLRPNMHPVVLRQQTPVDAVKYELCWDSRLVKQQLKAEWTAGKRLVIICETKKEVNECAKWLQPRRAGARVLMVTGDTEALRKVGTEFPPFDALIFNSALQYGTDISKPDYVHRVYAFVRFQPLAANAIAQMVKRVRSPQQSTVICLNAEVIHKLKPMQLPVDNVPAMIEWLQENIVTKRPPPTEAAAETPFQWKLFQYFRHEPRDVATGAIPDRVLSASNPSDFALAVVASRYAATLRAPVQALLTLLGNRLVDRGGLALRLKSEPPQPEPPQSAPSLSPQLLQVLEEVKKWSAIDVLSPAASEWTVPRTNKKNVPDNAPKSLTPNGLPAKTRYSWKHVMTDLNARLTSELGISRALLPKPKPTAGGISQAGRTTAPASMVWIASADFLSSRRALLESVGTKY